MATRGKSEDKVDRHAPWKAVPYESSDAAALQALQKGTATMGQQQQALKWLINAACGTYDMSFRPGEEGRRDTDFAEGRRFVGLTLVKLLNIKIGMLTTRREGE